MRPRCCWGELGAGYSGVREDVPQSVLLDPDSSTPQTKRQQTCPTRNLRLAVSQQVMTGWAAAGVQTRKDYGGGTICPWFNIQSRGGGGTHVCLCSGQIKSLCSSHEVNNAWQQQIWSDIQTHSILKHTGAAFHFVHAIWNGEVLILQSKYQTYKCYVQSLKGYYGKEFISKKRKSNQELFWQIDWSLFSSKNVKDLVLESQNSLFLSYATTSIPKKV